MRRNRKFGGAVRILPTTPCAWNGAVNHSLKKPTTPFSWKPTYQMSRNTVIDMPSVVLMSAVETTRRCSMPTFWPAHGSRSTGNRSMKFMRKTSAKMVIASGAISFDLPWKVSLTVPSTISTRISTAACSLPGTPLVARRATMQNGSTNSSASATVKNTLSAWIAWNWPGLPFTVRCVR